MKEFILFETACGYSLFERKESDKIGGCLDNVQRSFQKVDKIGKLVNLVAFVPFKDSADALLNARDVSEGKISQVLYAFLEGNVSGECRLYVSEKNLASEIKKQLSLDCISDEVGIELLRNIRLHATTLLKKQDGGNTEKARLGLAHGYSRSKVSFNVGRVENMVTQSICLLDQITKDINSFAMRAREVYSWHFPELSCLIPENKTYAEAVCIIKKREDMNETSMEEIRNLVDLKTAEKIFNASNVSIGSDINERDLENVLSFVKRVVSLSEYQERLQNYLKNKMDAVAPNLKTLVGETIGARLISHAGGLTGLAKCAASTVQILGAEKALFRALKTRGRTPKHGLLFHSNAVVEVNGKKKGRMARYVANKCSLASRIDCFSDSPNGLYGLAMKKQIDEKINCQNEEDLSPDRNIEIMQKVQKKIKKKEKKLQNQKKIVE